ncbi:MAG TPA: TetR/AcrR family transcriptional regulator [Pseudonocardiaceae bacterium]|nr:TetR/AcrR family transcriptional regulator [Pseudonocardiaceae bacterium]
MNRPADEHADDSVAPRQPLHRLRRDKRRKQIVQAAKRAFAQTGYARTSLDDVANAAGISRALIYRHFDSKTQLYVAVLDDFGNYLQTELGPRERWGANSVDTLVRVAIEDPDGFLLLFEHAAREPEFADVIDEVWDRSMNIAMERMPQKLGNATYVDWGARFIPAATIQALVTWIQAGQPRPDQAARTINDLIAAITAVLGADPH